MSHSFPTGTPRDYDPPYFASGSATVRLDLGVLLFAFIAALLFSLSSAVLFFLGVPYATSEGSPLSKIHPASYVAILTAFTIIGYYLINLRNVVITGRQAFNLAFFLCILAVVARNVVLGAHPISLLVDSFLLPAAMILILEHLGRPVIPGLAAMVHIFFLVNSLIGIAEFVSGQKLVLMFPWLLGPGAYLIYLDWRSYALLGHPLNASMATGIYIVAIAAMALSGRRTFAVYLLPIHLLAMLAFGGRAAAVSLGVSLVLMGTVALMRALYSDVMSKTTAFFLACGLIAVCAIPVLLFATDIFAPFIDRFTDDNGSALARLLITSVLEQVSWNDLLFGMNSESIRAVQKMFGLDFGVEVFWIAMVLLYGLIAMLPFFVLFVGRLILDVQNIYMGFVPFFFLMCATASLSLSGKTISYALYVLIMHAFRTPDRVEAPVGQGVPQ